MRICFLTPKLDVKTGWGRFAKEIVDGVKKEGFEMDVVEVGNKLGRGVIFSIIKDAIFLRKRIKKYDIVHCFDAFPYGVTGALASIGLNKKLIINGVGTWSVLPLYQKKYNWLLSWVYKKADKVLCISRFTRDEIAKKVKTNNLEVVNLGVDLNKFKHEPRVLEKKEKIILSVGAVEHRKGQHVVLKALPELKKHFEKIKYYILGNYKTENDYYKKLQTIIKENNLEEDVFFFKDLPDEELLEKYHECDLFVLPSVNINHTFEGFGLVFLEANACGKPAVGTLGCGAEDAIKEGHSGFLVPQEDTGATAEAIKKILKDDIFYKEMCSNALVWANDHSWEKTIKEYIKNYENITRKS